MMRKSGRAPARLAIAMGVLALTACDVPTTMPHWDTTWALPVEAMELTAGSLLPDAVTISPSGDLFELRVDGDQLVERLEDICDTCRPLNGLWAPKPHFSVNLESKSPLPNDLVSAPVVGGHATVELKHDFGFDPIRPSALARGSIKVIMLSASDTLAVGTIDGEVEAFPSGSSKKLVLPYRVTELRDTVTTLIIIDSPAGDLVEIDVSRSLSISIEENLLLVSEARVRVAGIEVELEDTPLEIVGGEALVNRIRGGALLMEIENPFEVTGSFSITLKAPGVSVSRQIPLEAGHSESRVEFTGPELQSILRKEDATMSAIGIVTATGGAVTIRPNQILKASSRIELTVASTEN